MLDRTKLLKELQNLSGNIFLDLEKEIDIAKKTWYKISDDKDFQAKIQNIQSSWLVPKWESNLNKTELVSLTEKEYCVVAVDGSQIYPDRHQGSMCYLINIGTVLLKYSDRSTVYFETQPFVYSNNTDDEISESPDIVDCKRQELEFSLGLEFCKKLKQENKENPIFLFDGSLIFWHLESKGSLIKNQYLDRYLGLLYEFYLNKQLIAGYISLPKSKELINLVRLDLCNFNTVADQSYKIVDHIVDAQLMSRILNSFERSIIFKNYSPITQDYPEILRPNFVYLNVMDEVVRIEVPAWIANDSDYLNQVLSVVVDQCKKGYGYPVCLAEAHEQAVIKTVDREFFYHYLQKMSSEQKQRWFTSKKSQKKRFMGI